VDVSAVDLFASMGRPVASGLKAGGNVQPEPPQAVFAGAPVLLFGETESEPGDRIELSWDGGRMDFDVPSGDAETGETLRLLRGARLITDWESRYPSEQAPEEASPPLAKRQQSRVAARLLALSGAYGLASREMSLVAVVKRRGDRPGELPTTRVAPVGMPQDTLFEAYFHKSVDAGACRPPLYSSPRSSPMDEGPRFCRAPLQSRRLAPTFADSTQDNHLVELAAILEPDGGMPGGTPAARAARTITALLAFAAEGHTLTRGAFRQHMARLAAFLKSLSVASDLERHLIERTLDAASTGKVPAGPWLMLAQESDTRWEQIEEALN
jgi:hypothetical protein